MSKVIMQIRDIDLRVFARYEIWRETFIREHGRAPEYEEFRSYLRLVEAKATGELILLSYYLQQRDLADVEMRATTN